MKTHRQASGQRRLRRKAHGKACEWTAEQVLELCQRHADIGNSWVAIAKHFYARSDNDVKNVFHSCRRAPALSARAPTLALSAYAKAVGPNCDDPLVRRRALEAARAVWEEQQQRLLKPEPNQQEGLPAPADCEAMTAEQPQAPEREAGGCWQLGGGELEPVSGTAPAACGGLKERPHHRLSRRPSSAPCEPFGAAISAPSSAAEACGGGTTAVGITPQAPCRPAAAPPLAASWTDGRWPVLPEPAAPAVGGRAVEARNDVPAGPADAWSWPLDRRQRSWTSQASSAAPAADAVGPAAVTVAAARAAAARLAPPRCSSDMGPAVFNKGSFGTGSGSGGMQSAGGGMQSAGGGDRWGAASPVGPGGMMPPQAVASAARSLSSCDHMSWDPFLPPRSASAPEPPCEGVRPTTPYDRLSDVPYAYGSPPQPPAWGFGGGSSSSNGSSFPAAPYGAAQDVPWGGSPTHSCTGASGRDCFGTVAGSNPGACAQQNTDETAPWGASAQPPLGWSQSGLGLQHQQALAAQPQQRALSYPLSYDPSQRPMQQPGAQDSGGRQSLSGPPNTWCDAPLPAHQPDAPPCTQRAPASSLPGPLPWLGAEAALEPPSRANGMQQQVVVGPWGPLAAPSLSGPSGFCCALAGSSGRPPVPGLTDMSGRLLSGFEDAGFAPEVEPLLAPDMLDIWLSMRGK